MDGVAKPSGRTHDSVTLAPQGQPPTDRRRILSVAPLPKASADYGCTRSAEGLFNPVKVRPTWR